MEAVVSSENGSGEVAEPCTPETHKVDLVSHPDAPEIWARAQECPDCLVDLAERTNRPVEKLKRFLDLWTARGRPDPVAFWDSCRCGEGGYGLPQAAQG